MENFKYLLLLLVFLAGVGCSENKAEIPKAKHQEKSKLVFEFGLKTSVRVIEVDSCEYVTMDSGTQGGTAVIHKQNCTFCLERNSAETIKTEIK